MIIIGSVGAILGLSDVALIESFKVIGILTVTIIGNVSFIAMFHYVAEQWLMYLYHMW